MGPLTRVLQSKPNVPYTIFPFVTLSTVIKPHSVLHYWKLLGVGVLSITQNGSNDQGVAIRLNISPNF